MTISSSPVQRDAAQLRELEARTIPLKTTKPIGTVGEFEFRSVNGRELPAVWSEDR
jgi:hypothetical protein